MNQFRPGGFSMLPLIVKNILIINVLFFLGAMAFESKFGVDLSDYLGLHYFQSDKFQPFQYITYMFMHGGFSHLFFNMFAFWMFGNVLENVWGPKRFLVYFFVTGLGAAAIHTSIQWYQISSMMSEIEIFNNTPSPELFSAFIQSHLPNANPQIFDFVNEWSTHPSDLSYVSQAKIFTTQILDLKMNIPTVGASGAVFGVLLAFGMLFPNTMLYVFFAIPIKAKYFVMIYGAIELYSGIANNPNDNVAHFAHLGGMLFGYFLIVYWRKEK